MISLTSAGAHWGSLDAAGAGERQGLRLVEGDPVLRHPTVEDQAQALRRGLDHAGELRAACGRGGGAVAGDVAEARCEAHDRRHATTELRRGPCEEGGHHDCNEDRGGGGGGHHYIFFFLFSIDRSLSDRPPEDVMGSD